MHLCIYVSMCLCVWGAGVGSTVPAAETHLGDPRLARHEHRPEHRRFRPWWERELCIDNLLVRTRVVSQQVTNPRTSFTDEGSLLMGGGGPSARTPTRTRAVSPLGIAKE